mgnify:CR=1 FL=1
MWFDRPEESGIRRKWNEETMQIQPTIMDNVVAGDAIIFPSL